MTTDSLGRRRQPGQTRGLRPLFPPLPKGERSRVIRVAMSQLGWAALERVVRTSHQPTPPRAVGELLERALGTLPNSDWQEWQIRKEKQLLERAS